MKRTVFKTISTLAVVTGAMLLTGCSQNNPVMPYGNGQFAAGCASVAAPIGFYTQNAIYTSTNLAAQSMQVGTGGVGAIPVAGGVSGYGLPTLTVQKIASDGSQLSLTAQSLSTGGAVGYNYPQYTTGSNSASLNGSLTLSPSLQQIINTMFGNYNYNYNYTGYNPGTTAYPTNSICVQSASLQAVVNPAGATADSRWLSGWIQIIFSNGRSMTMSF